jgi:hypothetical protein
MTPKKERVKVDENYERMVSSFYQVIGRHKKYQVCGMIGSPSIDLKVVTDLEGK